MGPSAAVFDLDRTLLRGSSTPAFSEALGEAGLAPRSSLPGQGALLKVYEVLGETLPSMALARAAALASRGRARSEVQAAAELAADRLEVEIQPYARGLIDLHRQAGRLLVLATTTPYDLVLPLATRLGFDAVVATRYATRTDDDGTVRYDGRLDGGFVWAAGKLSAVRRWARSAGVDLRSSWAYSDSVYDLPLLGAVGHPVAVNPDVRLLAAAILRRWPVSHLDAPVGVPKVLGLEPMDLVARMSGGASMPYVRFDIGGVHHIPRRGPAIVVANHRSYFDVAAIGRAVLASGRRPRGMAKAELFDAPVVGTLARALGTIRVDRAGGGSEAYARAEEALRSGEVLVLTPQGTIPRGEAFFDPVLVGRSGAARLAAATGAPVIPVGVWNTEAVWPRSARLPNVTNVLSPPTVRVRVGPPIEGLDGLDAEAATRHIMDAIVDQLPPEARDHRTPTAEELARTFPPG